MESSNDYQFRFLKCWFEVEMLCLIQIPKVWLKPGSNSYIYTFFRENILALWNTKENNSCYSIILDSSKCWNTGTHSHPVVWMMNEGLYFKADSSFRIMYVWEVKQENRRLKIAARNIQTVTLHCYNQKFESRLKGNIQTFILYSFIYSEYF